jgi:hypothetical protein
MGHTGTHAINATLYTGLKFDPIKDFAPIAPLISFNNVAGQGAITIPGPLEDLAAIVARDVV